MSWSNGYVGIPYADLGRDASGCDCWGLARLVYANELQIGLPSYAADYGSADFAPEVAALIHDRVGPPWSPVAGCVHQFDLLLLRLGRHDTHVGIAIDHRIMLHMAVGCSAKVEGFRYGRWAHRLVGVYRHLNSPLNRLEF